MLIINKFKHCKIYIISNESHQEYPLSYHCLLTIVNSVIYSLSYLMYVLAYYYFLKLDHIFVILQMCWIVEFPVFHIIEYDTYDFRNFKNIFYFFLMPKSLLKE